MSISPYAFLSILRTQKQQPLHTEERPADYLSVLDFVRTSVAQHHAAELGAALDDAAAAETLRELIRKYAGEHMAGLDYDRDSLVERIYQDMAGLGILTRCLQDPTVEEININAYDQIELVRPTGTEFLCGSEAFASPQAALDIVKRMVRMGGKLLDAQTPQVDSFIGSSTRITATIPPIVPAQLGVTASIRKQNKTRITREMLINAGTATADMLDFLTLCICNKTSIGIAGGTGSGKSSLQSFLINEYITHNEDHNNRVYLIEDTQELDIIKYDAENDRPARVISNLTQEAPVKVTMFDLTKGALRYHPALIVPAEVRDGAVYQAMSAGQTGHTILTSFHADSARDSYRRLVSLCHMAEIRQSDDILMSGCVDAWPIIVFAKQLKDNSRKITEIFEATGQEHGKVIGQTLYRFQVEDTVRDGRGHVAKVNGTHRRVGCISPKLYSRLRDNGASEQTLRRLFPDAVGEGDA